MKGRFTVDVYEVDDCGNALDIQAQVEVDGTDVCIEWEDFSGSIESMNLETIRELNRSELEDYVQDYIVSCYTEHSSLN